jgi:Tol biopolymer transport system component
MTPERWQQVKHVLQRALELTPEQRPAFLDSACSEDHSLRREVESLLSSNNQVRSNFMNSSPHAGLRLSPGTMLGDFEILSLLGSGGMGEVYRARDHRLERDVAIKVLPRFVSLDSGRLWRFEQEAKAAAALNHPNILAVFHMATYEGASYLVSELLEGETLREELKRRSIPLRNAIDYGIQILNGLAAAHEKGIVHRDLKPENLFVTKDGRIKILDFGLAKLTHQETETESTMQTLNTDAGAVLGTVGYMSPEQVRGLVVDHRSDIFAFGAVLYEMLSGRRAFHADTAADTMSDILNSNPAPLLEVSPTLPLGIPKIVGRCLEKSPNERFPSVRDVAFALEALSDISKSATRSPLGDVEERGAKLRALYVSGGLLALVFVLLAAKYQSNHAKQDRPVSQEWEQLTSFSDSVTAPALSKDGRMLAFVRNGNPFLGTGDVYLKMLPQGEPVQLTNDDKMKTNPVFSPDGSRIAYTTAPPWDTWVVPTLGGKPKMMLPNASGLTWIDDRCILFSEIKSGIHMGVMTAAENRYGERDVYVPARQDGMAHRSYFSPDHKWVLVASEMDTQGPKPCRLVPFDGTSPGKIVGAPESDCSYAGWSPDGRWMFFSLRNGTSDSHLWRQRFPDGQPEQFTFGPTEQDGIAVAPDGRSLLTAAGLSTGLVAVHDALGEHPIAFEGTASLMSPQFSSRQIFSPDGSKIYFLGRRRWTEPVELWEEELVSGSLQRPVPGMSLFNSYDISPDGKRIVFDSRDEQGQSRLWLASLDRSQAPRRLGSSTLPEMFPLFGPNGDLFFLQSEEDGNSYVYRRDVETGETGKAMSASIARFHTISPDGKWIVAEAPVAGENNARAVVAYSLSDGTTKRVCHSLCIVRWTLNGKYLHVGLYRSHNPSKDLTTFIVPLRHGESFPRLPAGGIETEDDVVHLPGVKTVSGWAYPGPDGARFAFSRSTVQRNIYRIPIP